LYDLASQSSLSAIVDEPTLADANAKLAMSQSLSQTVGAPIAGALVQLVGGILAVLVDAISYCISAALIKSLPPWDRPRPRAPEGGGPRGIASGVFEGVRILAGDEHLRRTAGIMAVLNLGGSIVGALFLVFTYRTLMLDPATVGVILAVGSLGGLAASIVAPRIQRALGVTQTIRVSALGASSALWLIPASAIGLAPLVLILYEAAFSFSATVFWICQVTLRQQRVASEVQGRTHAAVRVIALGTLPVGAFIGGIAASTLGVSNAIVLGCAAAFAGCVLLSLRWPGTQDWHQSLLHS
ncbi:MAG: MFS transporter, partial [Chloroflexota bacterium]|nr:MFS transporter [Chloroflexota bacterium]